MAETEMEAIKAMMGLENYLNSTGLKPMHRELIKIRASQLNGCTYCIHKHTRDARKLGESEERLYLLSSWHETNFYSEEERAILALTEEMTLLQNGVSDAVYSDAASLFDANYLAQLMMAIVTINAWNRIGVATQLQPEIA